MIKAKNKRTTSCMKLKFARSIKRRKGLKFTTKVLAKSQMSGVTMDLTSQNFTLCLHLLHLNFIIVNCQLLCCPVLKTEPTAAYTRPSKTSGPWVRGKMLINIDEIGTETRGIIYLF